MALKKAIPTEYGIDAEYWKITGLNITYTGKRCTITLVGYATQEARELEKNNLVMKVYRVDPGKFDNYFSCSTLDSCNPVASGYEYIKGNDDLFVDALDV